MAETITVEDVFQAYYDCRRNKARTGNAIAFGLDYEAKLLDLYRDISAGHYRVGRSIAFIVEKPTKREIFAGDFRDRVVHHLIFNKINRVLEKDFIHDSYSCRKGKGARFGIGRAKRFMRQVTRNFTENAYVMKLDISGFFMGIDRRRLFDELSAYLERNYNGGDIGQVIGLCETVVFHDPASDCLVKGDRAGWIGLPKHKSLFFAPEGRGLPIGNLTSQVFGNFYLSRLDHFVKSVLGVRYYGRYVDDLLFFHADERFLREVEKAVGEFLERELALSLNRKKTYLGEVGNGFPFLGSYLKPHAELVGKRTKSNFAGRIAAFGRKHPPDGIPPDREAMEAYRSSINSYLGTISRCDSSRLRKKWVPVASGVLPHHLSYDPEFRKIILNTKDHGHE